MATVLPGFKEPFTDQKAVEAVVHAAGLLEQRKTEQFIKTANEPVKGGISLFGLFGKQKAPQSIQNANNSKTPAHDASSVKEPSSRSNTKT